jgi:hypothetical protein
MCSDERNLATESAAADFNALLLSETLIDHCNDFGVCFIKQQ